MGVKEEQNKRVVTSLLAAFKKGDLDEIGRYYADDVEWTLPLDPQYSSMSGTMNKSKLFESLKMMIGLMPAGTRFTVNGMTAEGDRVAVEAESDGETFAGPYHNRYHFLFELRDGKIVGGREYMDSAYLSAFAARLSGTQNSGA